MQHPGFSLNPSNNIFIPLRHPVDTKKKGFKSLDLQKWSQLICSFRPAGGPASVRGLTGFPAADFVWVGTKHRAGVFRKTAGSACGQVLPTCETHKLVHCCAKLVQRFVRDLHPLGRKEPAGKYHETRLEHQSTATAPSPTERDPETVQAQEGRVLNLRVCV